MKGLLGMAMKTERYAGVNKINHHIWENRFCGTMAPLFSLASPYGIGDMGKGAEEFITWLHNTGQSVWQLLPLGPTGAGNSPYQVHSSAAGDPIYIDLEDFEQRGWLKRYELERAYMSYGPIDYKRVRENKNVLLHLAYDRAKQEYLPIIEEALERIPWLWDYCIYRGLKKTGKTMVSKMGNESRDEFIKRSGISKVDILRTAFLQVIWLEQWQKLKSFANSKSIYLMGDLPIYISPDSVELWSTPELFETDGQGMLTKVGGCPPDAFTSEGQLWGNPLYRWSVHQDEDYRWWGNRLKQQWQLYDLVRIDHFRGLNDYWAIPIEAETAKEGWWEKGPGIDLFNALESRFGKVPLVAEDLGFLTEEVHSLRRESGLPGMKVLQFAFYDEDSIYLPHNYEPHTLVYTGTHDNTTTLDWYRSLDSIAKKRVDSYVNPGGSISEAMIRVALTSVAKGAIIPLADWLNLGSEGRINEPGKASGQWRWRMERNALRELDFTKYKELITISGRGNIYK
ncbi:MAG: 4-alpha-glucanotransferase [Tissierellia bacterium]|nr:4-alpha-glucanotransferase [Tissierellia bacterium]